MEPFRSRYGIVSTQRPAPARSTPRSPAPGDRQGSGPLRPSPTGIGCAPKQETSAFRCRYAVQRYRFRPTSPRDSVARTPRPFWLLAPDYLDCHIPQEYQGEDLASQDQKTPAARPPALPGIKAKPWLVTIKTGHYCFKSQLSCASEAMLRTARRSTLPVPSCGIASTRCRSSRFGSQSFGRSVSARRRHRSAGSISAWT